MIAKGGAIAAIEDLLIVEPAILGHWKTIGRFRRFGCLLLDNFKRFLGGKTKNSADSVPSSFLAYPLKSHA